MPRFDPNLLAHETLSEIILDETTNINNLMYEIGDWNGLMQRHRDDQDMCDRLTDMICKNYKKERRSTKKIYLCKKEKLRRERMALKAFIERQTN